MNPDVDGFSERGANLSVQLFQFTKRAAVEEVAAKVRHGSLHPSFDLGPVGTACHGPEAVVGSEAEHLGVEHRSSSGVRSSYGGAHPTEGHRSGDTLKGTENLVQPAQAMSNSRFAQICLVNPNMPILLV